MEPGVQEFEKLIAYRDMVRDLVPCDQFGSVCTTLGLMPSSQDVDEREHRSSHRRIEKIAPLSPHITETSTLAGEVVHNLFTSQTVDCDDLPTYIAIATAAVYGSILRLVDQGKLKIL